MGCARILLADDQQEILERLEQILDREFEVVASVQDGKRALEAAARLDPDLLVLDICMPGLTGIEVATRLKHNGSASRAKVIFVTVHSDPDYVEAAFAAGAFGYALKPRLAADLVPAIREVLRGGTFVSPPLGTAQRDTRDPHFREMELR
jgi:DNA-binding NarL/FixJ family response regulator